MTSLQSLEQKLGSPSGNESNAIAIPTKQAIELLNLDFDFFDRKSKFTALVKCENRYVWVTYNDESDWKLADNTETIAEQIDEEGAKNLLKHGKMSYGAGDV